MTENVRTETTQLVHNADWCDFFRHVDAQMAQTIRNSLLSLASQSFDRVLEESPQSFNDDRTLMQSIKYVLDTKERFARPGHHPDHQDLLRDVVEDLRGKNEQEAANWCASKIEEDPFAHHTEILDGLSKYSQSWMKRGR